MIQSRNWSSIERLPDDPTVAKMTGNGYWLGGKFHPTRAAAVSIPEEPKRSWLWKLMG